MLFSLFCSHTDKYRLPDTGLAPSALAGNSKLVGPLSFEPLPGTFSVCSVEVMENALFNIGSPGKKLFSGCCT